MPAMSLDEAGERYNEVVKFVKNLMVDGRDYGTIPGTPKPTLLQPGAQKLITFFGLTQKSVLVDKIEIWDDEKALFNYNYRTELWHGDTLVATCDGSCNSKENRYRWRWVDYTDLPEGTKTEGLKKKVDSKGHYQWQIDAGDTSGKYAKPEEYWEEFRTAMRLGSAKVYDKLQPWNNDLAPFVEIESVSYRVENDDPFTMVNTYQKMAQKRSMVGAVIIACNASEFFTQDMEDLTSGTNTIEDAEFVEVAVGEFDTKKPANKATQPAKFKKLASFDGTEMEDLEKALAVKIESGEEFNATDFWNIVNASGYDKEYGREVIENFTDENGISWMEACQELVYGQSD